MNRYLLFTYSRWASQDESGWEAFAKSSNDLEQLREVAYDLYAEDSTLCSFEIVDLTTETIVLEDRFEKIVQFYQIWAQMTYSANKKRLVGTIQDKRGHTFPTHLNTIEASDLEEANEILEERINEAAKLGYPHDTKNV